MKTAQELLYELKQRNLEPDHAMLYRAALRTFKHAGGLSKEITNLLRRMLEITGEETN